MPYTAD
jgi:DNA-directed RNA polymerase beta subunit